MKRFATMLLCLGFPLLLSPTVRLARAALGEPAASVETDRKALSAVHRATTTTTTYTVQEVVSDANSVREYVSPSGVVFGIAWNGITQPDLATLLGSYLDDYEQSLHKAARPHGRRSLQVKGDRVIVEKWGNMRNQQGRAYVPSLIPSGVSPDEIK